MNIQNINNYSYLSKINSLNKNIKVKTKGIKNDEFTKNSQDASNDGKFTFKEAIKNFGKGIISPVTTIMKHPFMTIGAIASTAAVCSVVPVLTPILAVGFGALSFVQLGKGIYNAAKEYKNGNYDNSEKAFEQIGQGAISSALSVLGLKQAAKVAKEAKVMSNLKVNVLDAEQKAQISKDVTSSSMISALKENLSLIFTKEGRQAVLYQFKPSTLKSRVIDLVKFVKGKKVPVKKKIEYEKSVDQAEKFRKSPEGIRRAALSDEQIEAEVHKSFDKAFDDLGIPKKLRPKLKIDKASEKSGGSYNASNHTIDYNPESYRAGTFEIDDVIMHEATHCKEALLRAGIPQDKVNEIVKNELINRVFNGESEKIILRGSFLGTKTMDPPKMNTSLKKDFVRFACENIYKKDNNLVKGLSSYIDEYEAIKSGSKYASSVKFDAAQKEIAPFIGKIKAILDKHPEFTSQFDSYDDALNEMLKYSLSHNVRYNSFANVSVGRINPDDLPKLSPELLKKAEQSLVDNITTIEGNGRISGINGLFANNNAFNQYQFSPEEVLAQKNGKTFLIKNLSARMEQLKQSGNLSPEEESFINSMIEKSKLIIEYKTKGLEYYQKYTQLINNPNDENLAQIVKTMESELNAMKSAFSPVEYERVEQFVEIMGSPDLATSFVPGNIFALFGQIKDED